MKPYLAATILLALVACATPQQRCITKAAPDLPVLNRLIAETEGNLSRGYAFTEVEMEIPVWKLCRGDLTVGTGEVSQSLCLETETTTSREPVAIDLTAEAAKLASMRARRDAIEAQAQPAFAQCQAQFPS
jgi:hypothetical protein